MESTTSVIRVSLTRRDDGVVCIDSAIRQHDGSYVQLCGINNAINGEWGTSFATCTCSYEYGIAIRRMWDMLEMYLNKLVDVGEVHYITPRRLIETTNETN